MEYRELGATTTGQYSETKLRAWHIETNSRQPTPETKHEPSIEKGVAQSTEAAPKLVLCDPVADFGGVAQHDGDGERRELGACFAICE